MTDKAAALAEKITMRAEDALRDLDQTMVLGRWPADFRAIMWGAVADIAFKRKVEAEFVGDNAVSDQYHADADCILILTRMNEQLQAALSWIAAHDPLIVERARERFGLIAALSTSKLGLTAALQEIAGSTNHTDAGTGKAIR